MNLKLRLIPGEYSIYKLKNIEKLDLPNNSCFVSLTVTEDEYSLISSEDISIDFESVSRGWRCIRVDGDLPFDAVGIIADLCNILANEKISLFAVCTYDRDFILVEVKQFKKAKNSLLKAGHRLSE